uniref:Uncharacterized protein n=1 Tax=Oryzias sinensis TaxID=183150 RepID=A0A8C7Y6G5_9TELE
TKGSGPIPDHEIGPGHPVRKSASSKPIDVKMQHHPLCVWLQHNIMVQRRRDSVKPEMPTAAERLEMLDAVGGKPY